MNKVVIFISIVWCVAIFTIENIITNNIYYPDPNLNNQIIDPPRTLKQKNSYQENQSISKKNTEKLKPVELKIMGKSVPIEAVNKTKDGRMDTIEDANIIAWYEYGSVPGDDTGNALLAGHNTWKGKRGVLDNMIEKLNIGDTITITLNDGSIIIQKLVELYEFNRNEVPAKMMELDGEGRTTIITCSGKFNYLEGTSENRTFAIFKTKY